MAVLFANIVSGGALYGAFSGALKTFDSGAPVGGIRVIDAVHFDKSDQLVSNVYGLVRSQDDVWSTPIRAGELIRVTFEKNLSNGNVVDAFVRNPLQANASFEIYRAGTVGPLLGKSRQISAAGQFEHVPLSGLAKPSDAFDIKVRGGFLEFDYVHDANLYVAQVTEGNATYYDLHHTNYTLRILAGVSGVVEITNVSRNAENSVKSTNAFHNKTSRLFPGDLVDLTVKNSGGSWQDILFLGRYMVNYTKSGSVYNLTTSNALSTSAWVAINTSGYVMVKTNMFNNDLNVTVSHILSDYNTHPVSFMDTTNIAGVPITGVKIYAYFDFDLANVAGSETSDDFYALIVHTDSTSVVEQIQKEGIIRCDGSGDLIEALTKCSDAAGDYFYVRQRKGAGVGGDLVYAGLATRFASISQVDVYQGITNPSTDTDGKREVPEELVDVSQRSLAAKVDTVMALNVLNGTLQPGQQRKKYVGALFGTTEQEFQNSADEHVHGNPVFFEDTVARNATTNATVAQAGAYFGLNITTNASNTGTDDLFNVNITCNVTTSSQEVVLSDSYMVNMSASDPVRTFQCGGILNTANTILPGVYTIFFQSRNTTNATEVKENATGTFTILSDYVGTASLSLDDTQYKCSENVTIQPSVTNTGNTNFTGNLSHFLYYAGNMTFIQTLDTRLFFVQKDSSNSTTLYKNVTECNAPLNYSIRANFKVTDANNGEEHRNATTSYVLEVWSYYYGSLSGNLTLRKSASNYTVFRWPGAGGNVFAVSSSASISWQNITALGRYPNGTTASLDFQDVDSNLNLSIFSDSIQNLFSTDGSTPANTRNFTLFATKNLPYVPITNSTNNSNFSTGILWDAGDSPAGSEYDTVNKQNVLFVTELNASTQGKYGVYDYEIRVPSTLDTALGGSTVDFYAELR